MQEQDIQTATSERNRTAFKPQLVIYHPNGKGTGGAAKFELHRAHDSSAGCIMLKMASQCAIGSRSGETPQFARFDWENAITVKLDFSDISAMLQVLNGECESLGDGHGLYHRSAKAATKIAMRHVLEPKSGYSLDLYRTMTVDNGETRTHLLITPTEAEGLRAAILGSMSAICFGA
jgi:hypothetical protein